MRGASGYRDTHAVGVGDDHVESGYERAALDALADYRRAGRHGKVRRTVVGVLDDRRRVRRRRDLRLLTGVYRERLQPAVAR